MRRMVLWWLAAGACSGPADDPDSYFVAFRPMNGDWTVLDPPPVCGEPLDTPADTPFEVVLVEYWSDGAYVEALRAGPGEIEAWPRLRNICKPPDPQFDLTSVEVGLVGADYAFMTIGKSYQGGHAPTTAAVELGVQDIVALTGSQVTNSADRYIIRRDFNVTAQGFVLDASEGGALEQRPTTITGPDPQRTYRGAATVVTAGGAELGIPSRSSNAVWVIPEVALVAGDREVLSVFEQLGGGYVSLSLDLRAIPAGSIAATLPPPIDAIECAAPGASPMLAVTTTASFNEFSLTVHPSERAVLPANVSFHVVKTRGWPAAGLELPDVLAIPGWDPQWAIPPTAARCSLEVCERTDQRTSCSMMYQPLL